MTDEARDLLAAAVKNVVDVALAEAEARGYARAIAALRDEERYSNWWTSTGVQPVGTVRQHLADYLETIEKPLLTTRERTATS